MYIVYIYIYYVYYKYIMYIDILVGGFNPSEKYWSIGMIIPNIWENDTLWQTNPLWVKQR